MANPARRFPPPWHVEEQPARFFMGGPKDLTRRERK